MKAYTSILKTKRNKSKCVDFNSKTFPQLTGWFNFVSGKLLRAEKEA
jgi:hypothetical protein